MGSIISMVSISPEGFMPSILLLVVVIVTVVIVAVILVVFVVAIHGVVIVVMIIRVEVVVTIIGVVVVSLRFRGGNISFDTSSQMVKFIFHLLDLSLGIILLYQKLLEFNPDNLSPVQLLQENTDFVRSNQRISPTTPSEPLKLKDVDVLLGGCNEIFLKSKISRDRHGEYEMSDPIGGSVSRYKGLRKSVGGDVVDLTSDENPTDEDRDTGMCDLTGVLVSLGGEIFSEEKKYQESNIGGSDNTRDRGKITVVTLVGERMSPWKGEAKGDMEKPGDELARL
nr:hypothetical protein [Tanacetum cinerariifolium]